MDSEGKLAYHTEDLEASDDDDDLEMRAASTEESATDSMTTEADSSDVDEILKTKEYPDYYYYYDYYGDYVTGVSGGFCALRDRVVRRMDKISGSLDSLTRDVMEVKGKSEGKQESFLLRFQRIVKSFAEITGLLMTESI